MRPFAVLRWLCVLLPLTTVGCAPRIGELNSDGLQMKADLVDSLWKVTDEQTAEKYFFQVVVNYQDKQTELEKVFMAWQKNPEIADLEKFVEKAAITAEERNANAIPDLAIQAKRIGAAITNKPEIQDFLKEYVLARHKYLTNKLPLDFRFLRERERIQRLMELMLAERVDVLANQGVKNPYVTFEATCPELQKFAKTMAGIIEIPLKLPNSSMYTSAIDSSRIIEGPPLKDKFPALPLPGFPSVSATNFFQQPLGPPGAETVTIFAYRGQFPRDVSQVAYKPIMEGVALTDFKDEDGYRVQRGQLFVGSATFNTLDPKTRQPIANTIEVIGGGSTAAIYYPRWVGSGSAQMTLPPPKGDEGEQLPSPTARRDFDIFLGYVVPATIE